MVLTKKSPHSLTFLIQYIKLSLSFLGFFFFWFPNVVSRISIIAFSSVKLKVKMLVQKNITLKRSCNGKNWLIFKNNIDINIFNIWTNFNNLNLQKKLNLMFNGKQRCAIAKNKEGTKVINKIQIEYIATKLSRIF